MTWKEQAKSLGFEQSRKIVCCSSDPSTYISNSTAGIRIGPCFRCGYADFEAHSGLSVKELLRMREATQEVRGMKTKPVTVPMTEAPQEAMLWTLLAGISPEEATDRYGFGWSARIGRVIVPLLHDFKDTGAFLARSVNPKVKPKYVMSANGKGVYWYAGKGTTVLVEDVLSAIAVHRAGYRAVSANGTFFPVELVNLAAKTGRLIAWLDNDEAGKKAFRHLRKSLGTHDVSLHRVQSNRDPKLHGPDEIQALVSKALKGSL